MDLVKWHTLGRLDFLITSFFGHFFQAGIFQFWSVLQGEASNRTAGLA